MLPCADSDETADNNRTHAVSLDTDFACKLMSLLVETVESAELAAGPIVLRSLRPTCRQISQGKIRRKCDIRRRGC
jgi:hypothetical protein